jgi:hypothetical protein
MAAFLLLGYGVLRRSLPRYMNATAAESKPTASASASAVFAVVS